MLMTLRQLWETKDEVKLHDAMIHVVSRGFYVRKKCLHKARTSLGSMIGHFHIFFLYDVIEPTGSEEEVFSLCGGAKTNFMSTDVIERDFCCRADVRFLTDSLSPLCHLTICLQ